MVDEPAADDFKVNFTDVRLYGESKKVRSWENVEIEGRDTLREDTRNIK
jgi:hypothetical protein